MGNCSETESENPETEKSETGNGNPKARAACGRLPYSSPASLTYLIVSGEVGRSPPRSRSRSSRPRPPGPAEQNDENGENDENEENSEIGNGVKIETKMKMENETLDNRETGKRNEKWKITDRPTDRPADRPTGRPTDRPTDRLTGRPTG